MAALSCERDQAGRQPVLCPSRRVALRQRLQNGCPRSYHQGAEWHHVRDQKVDTVPGQPIGVTPIHPSWHHPAAIAEVLAKHEPTPPMEQRKMCAQSRKGQNGRKTQSSSQDSKEQTFFFVLFCLSYNSRSCLSGRPLQLRGLSRNVYHGTQGYG